MCTLYKLIVQHVPYLLQNNAIKALQYLLIVFINNHDEYNHVGIIVIKILINLQHSVNLYQNHLYFE